jgi:ribonuclease Z
MDPDPGARPRDRPTARELVILGTASQVPNRLRHTNGYLLLFDDEGTLFDPGEGTQRQLILAGVPVSRITRICITHFHGDHCLGLPGVIQRLSLDGVPHPVDVAYPASGVAFFERLRGASVFEDRANLRLLPVSDPGLVTQGSLLTLKAVRLDHRPETFGWRLEEQPRRHFIFDRLERLGIRGPDVGRLRQEGHLRIGERDVVLDDVTEVWPGQIVSFVMDTGWCDEAVQLAQDADLLICESTFSRADESLARAYRHLTAADAGRLAEAAGARRLVLTHFSQRYGDLEPLGREAAEHFGGEIVVARELQRIPLPPRRASGASA